MTAGPTSPRPTAAGARPPCSSTGATAASARPSTTGRAGPDTVAIGDVNGDGKTDVVSANGSTDPNGDLEWLDSVSVLLGKGDGTLRPKRDYRLRRRGPARLRHRPDRRRERRSEAGPGDRQSRRGLVDDGLRQRRQGTFRRHFDFGRNDYTSQEVGPGSEAVALGDLNGDRRLDVVEARSDEVSVFVNAPGMCTVPDVSSSKLAAARRLLAERHCRIGRIKWHKGGTAGYIWSQRPEVGVVIPEGREGEPRRRPRRAGLREP